jgi:hypothetical protein
MDRVLTDSEIVSRRSRVARELGAALIDGPADAKDDCALMHPGLIRLASAAVSTRILVGPWSANIR